MLLVLQLSIPPLVLPQQETAPPHSAKQILVLYTYAGGITVNQKATAAFFSVLTSRGFNTDDVFLEYLDLQRNNSPAYRQRVASLLLDKYGKRDIGLIVTAHTAALEFVLKECKGLFPNVPVFSFLSAWQEEIETRNAGRRILLRPQSMDMGGTLEIALKMFPGTQKVVFVVGAAPADKRFEYEARRIFESWRGKVEIEYTSDRTYEEMLQLVATLPRRSIVIYCDWFSDVTGRTFTPLEVGKMVAKAANAPVFCIWDTIMGWGTIGGSLLSFEAEGAYAAKTALDILDKKIVLTKPVTTLANSKTFMFDWQQLKRWGVNESVLPKGSIIINREFTLWDYRYYLLGISAFVLLETALIIFLIVQRRRKRVAEESLRNAEAKYRRIFEGGVEGIYEASVEGRCLTANPAMARMLGYDSEDEMCSSITDSANQIWANPDERARYVRLLEEHNEVPGFETEFRRKDRMNIWVSINGRRVSGPDGRTLFYSTFVEDITERKEMEMKERRRAEQWQATFDSIPQLVILLDRDYTVARVNAAAKSFLGLPAREILGKHCHALMHGTNGPIGACPVARMMRSRTHEEIEIYDETRRTWFRISTDPIFDKTGEIIQIVHIAEDITNEKRAEIAGFAARKEQLRTDRLLQMGEMTASIAHELNQPLTSILSNARAAVRLAKSGKLGTDELVEILEDIANDDKRAGNIIRSLREIVKSEDSGREQIALNDMVREVAALFHSEAIIQRIRIETELADSLPPVNGDKVQLQQVLINLMMNAADSMEGSATHRRIVIGTRMPANGGVMVAVRDFGTGIDENDITRIFDPFFTTKGSGLGMGLSLCRSIIESHGGRIWAENSSGGGATFYFTLPVAGAQGEALGAQQVPESEVLTDD
jgi:PAS domain S-box-containing protein